MSIESAKQAGVLDQSQATNQAKLFTFAFCGRVRGRSINISRMSWATVLFRAGTYGRRAWQQCEQKMEDTSCTGYPQGPSEVNVCHGDCSASAQQQRNRKESTGGLGHSLATEHFSDMSRVFSSILALLYGSVFISVHVGVVYVLLWVPMYTEARGQCQVSSSVSLHFIF